jgi:uncharacterized protein (TIGR03435 family)
MMNLFAVVIVWFAQTAASPAFEVATIKEARPPSSIESIQAGQFHLGITINGSRADYGFMSLSELVQYAYRVKRNQVWGPDWMKETRWDILATIPESQAAARAPDMMQRLLAERFKLSTHRENREQSVYALVVGKGPLKMMQAASDEESRAAGGFNIRINNNGSVAISSPTTGTMRMMQGPNGGMQLQMTNITMAGLADRLAQFTDRPVVDATGLNGSYQVTLDLPIEAMRGMAFAQKLAVVAGFGSFGVQDAGALDTSIASIIKSVKDLGLELESRKAPIETIIVDRVEKTPTAN